MNDTDTEDFGTEMQLATWGYRALLLITIGMLGLDLHGLTSDPWYMNAVFYGSIAVVGLLIAARLVLSELGGKEVDLDVE